MKEPKVALIAFGTLAFGSYFVITWDAKRKEDTRASFITALHTYVCENLHQEQFSIEPGRLSGKGRFFEGEVKAGLPTNKYPIHVKTADGTLHYHIPEKKSFAEEYVVGTVPMRECIRPEKRAPLSHLHFA